MDLMFGQVSAGMTLHMPADFHPVLLAILPPGAFIGLGLLVALKNYIDKKATKAKQKDLGIQVAIQDPSK